MKQYYLAIDIGASSGRHILGSLQEGVIEMEEIHRFENGMVDGSDGLCWRLDQLFAEIVAGMKKCKELGKIPVSVGIDTWAVDYVLLDKSDELLGGTAAYRNARTKGMDQRVYELIPGEALYQKTGIQKQIFNTIYQLMAVKNQKSELMDEAESMLLVPDYFHFLLSGVKRAEYTNATTTQLVSPETKDWDWELIDKLGYPRRIFQRIVTPGTALGDLLPELQQEVGYNCRVVAPATHDTGAAVMAVPSSSENVLYISSGTWSLMGTELSSANCSTESRLRNFTNEGGYDYRFRYLKNIMGLWMIQCVRKELPEKYSYAELCEQASRETIPSLVNCNEDRFLAPASMIDELQKACGESGQPIPETPGQLASVIYNSLAACYGKTVREIEEMTGISYDRIHVVGGGANAEYLNLLTARHTGKTVVAGPTEATAIGNLIAQMIAGGKLPGLAEGRNVVEKSFDIKTIQN